MRDDLKLELNEDKTLITHARTQAASFLGYQITVQHSRDRPAVNGVVRLRVPRPVIKAAAETSLLKTLAAKHRSTVTAMARKHRATITRPHGPRVCFQATVERPGRKSLVTRCTLRGGSSESARVIGQRNSALRATAATSPPALPAPHRLRQHAV